MTDTHEEFMGLAETTLDLMCCNVPEAGDVREESIKDIARALSQAHQDGIREGKRQAAGLIFNATISMRHHPHDAYAEHPVMHREVLSAMILSTITDEAE